MLVFRKIGIRALTLGEVLRQKKSDTLFILASGPTINEIGSKQWESISMCDSIGLNFWVAHDFTPNSLRFELPYECNRRNYFFKMLKGKKSSFDHTKLFYDHHLSEKILPNKLHGYNPNQLFYPSSINLVGMNQENFKKSLRYAMTFSRKYSKYLFLPYKRGSVTTLISLGYLAGYKNIVLCGVDLNNVEYFYDSKYYKKKHPGFGSGQSGDILKSMDSKISDLSLADIIITMNEEYFSKGSQKLFVSSKNSILFPKIPCYHN